MTVITISGQIGAVGDIPKQVGRMLGCRVVDAEIGGDLARRLGWTEADVRGFDERVGGFFERLTRFLDAAGLMQVDAGAGVWSPGATFLEPSGPLRTAEERFIKALRDQLIEYAEEDDVVIVGRGGAAILSEWPLALHVRLDSPIEDRVRCVAMKELLSRTEAERLVRESDAQREAWHRHYFGVGYRTPYLYGLTLNTHMMRPEWVAEIVCEAVGEAAVLPDGRVPVH